MSEHTWPLTAPIQPYGPVRRRRAPRPLSVVPIRAAGRRGTPPSQEVVLKELIDDLCALMDMGLIAELPGKEGVRYVLTEMGLSLGASPHEAA